MWWPPASTIHHSQRDMYSPPLRTAWIPTQRIPRNRQKLALVLLVVVIVIYQRVNKRRPIPGRLSTRSLQRVAIKVEEILQVFIEIFRS